MKTIAVCASVDFYKHAVEMEADLVKLGFKVILPSGAIKMRESGDFDARASKTWYDKPEDFQLKADFMRTHFKSIEESDLILVINDEKHGVKGYVGPNVAMEMGLAFYLGKPIYVLNKVSSDMPTYEEVMGLGSIIIDGDLSKIGKD